MIKDYLRNLGGKILWKLLKYAVILGIAFFTWETIVKENSESKGKQLYHEGKQLYRETRHSTVSPTYDMREDSSYIYLIEK